ncbi:septum formation protein Maf [Candidatus Peregrinibacteria bacterium]|nr:septum formation protein Maf [Candidatus Peregrinibacteria bacterium]
MLSELTHHFSKNSPLILASKSPQRIRILKMLGIPFVSVEHEFEEFLDHELSPEKNVEMLAEGKAQSLVKKYPNSCIVGIDTLVVSESGKILGKPQHKEEAREMFREKSGKKELIISGISIIKDNQKITAHEVSSVEFMEFSEADIEKILELNEWKNKSGGIMIEGKSSMYIESIEGNFWNIVGFPVPTFLELLKSI